MELIRWIKNYLTNDQTWEVSTAEFTDPAFVRMFNSHVVLKYFPFRVGVLTPSHLAHINPAHWVRKLFLRTKSRKSLIFSACFKPQSFKFKIWKTKIFPFLLTQILHVVSHCEHPSYACCNPCGWWS